MKNITLILSYVTLATLVSCICVSCKSDKGENTFKEIALSGTPVSMDIPDIPVYSVISNNGYIAALNKIVDKKTYNVSNYVSVYSVKEEEIVLAGTLKLPDVYILDKATLFPTDIEGYICGISLMSLNRFYGITETLELRELEDVAQKMKSHIFHYTYTEPVCLQDGHFYFVEVGDDSNYSLKRTEDEGTIKTVCYMNKTDGDWIPYLGSASGNDGTIVFGYSFYRKILFFNTETGKAVSVSFDAPGFSAEAGQNPAEDILAGQRKYYGGYIHVGEKAFLANLNGFIFASGEDTPNAVLDVFSLTGKPVERLLLDRSGYCAVDEKGGRIFLFTYGDNPELYTYNYNR